MALFAANALQAGENRQAEPLAVYLEGGLWHFLDGEGREMFPAMRLSDFGGYSEGYFRVKTMHKGKERWLFLDRKGKVAAVPDCEESMVFSEGLALSAVPNPDKADTNYTSFFGYVDTTGKTVIPFQYIDATYFDHGLAWARTKDTKGYIDRKGNYVFKFDTLIGYAYGEGLAPVNNYHYKMGYIDTTGRVVIPLLYDEVKPFSEGKAFFHNEGYGGYLDKKGNVIVKPRWDDGKPFSEGYAFVGGFFTQKLILWGLIDSTGKLVIKLKYETVRNFHEGLAAVAKDRSWGFIDPQGNYVLPSQYSSAGSFYNGLAWASIPNSKYGFIDKTGSYIIEIPKPKVVYDLRMNVQVY